MSIKNRITNYRDRKYSLLISKIIEKSSEIRKIGISRRDQKYISNKILEGNAILAFYNGILAGFSYIAPFRDRFVSNSGMILFFEFRSKGYAKYLKKYVFKLSSYKFPKFKIFGITTSPYVFKLNLSFKFKSSSFLELTLSNKFWTNCSSCINYDILSSNDRTMCFCNGYIYEQKNILKDKVILAYSGGLDTSFCLKFLKEQGYEMYTVQVNTGGFNDLELKIIEENAYNIGSIYHRSINAINFYYENCVKYLIFGNILRNNIYPLSVSSERIFQAIKIAEFAYEINTIAIAHGSSCAGNDQIRFDIAFNILCPDKRIISPIRDNQYSRKEELNYLHNHGIDILWTKARYSINKGLWGTSISGEETLISNEKLPSTVYLNSIKKLDIKNIKLGFDKGEFISINRNKSYAVDNIVNLENITSKFGIGRNTHIGDTIIGIKGRIALQASSALIIIKAHQLLEKHILTKWQIYWKDQLSNWYGMLLHEAQYIEPVMRNIEAFLIDSQIRVCGDVYIKLYPYRFELIGIKSKFDMMKFHSTKYGEISNDLNSTESKGFIKIFEKQMKLYHNND